MFETLGHYKILDRIGAGGIGEVYRARDTRLGRTVAVTSVAAGDRRRCPIGATLLRRRARDRVLSHPNIAALYEVGEDQGQLFLVFEFVPGETLTNDDRRPPDESAPCPRARRADSRRARRRARRRHRPWRHHARHDHRHAKGNAKVLDFGLARWADRSAATAYMSPEEKQGDDGDHRTDIFSLGVVLFEMLTGKLPFHTKTAGADQLLTPALTSINRALPVDLDRIIAKMLAGTADKRYTSAAELAADLRSVVATFDARTAVVEPAIISAVRKPSARRRSGRAIALATIVAVIAATAWWQRAAIERTWRRTLGPPPAARIAMIPFDGDPDQAFFADGFTDDLAARLGQTPGLTVLGRAGARQYRGQSPSFVARELNAAVVLTGSVHREGDALNVTVHLIDPRDNAVLSSGKYTRDTSNVFAVQAQIAEDLAQALHVRLEPTASSARAASRLADRRGYEMYLRGRQAVADRNVAEAKPLYESAILLDDGFAKAYRSPGRSAGARTDARIRRRSVQASPAQARGRAGVSSSRPIRRNPIWRSRSQPIVLRIASTT